MFKYKIFIPSGLVFEGQTTMAVLPGDQGEIGILKEHLHFFVLLQAGIIKIYNDNQITNQYFIEGGILKVKEDILVFTEEVLDLAKVERQALEIRYNKAKQELSSDLLNEKFIKEYHIAEMILSAINVKISN